MSIKPLADRVVAKKEAATTTTASGILLGEAKEKSNLAIIESVGPDVKAVKKGDKTTIIGALGYFILPLDILPDFIPMVGFTDDLSAILLALHAVWKNITPEIKAMAAAKASELFGDFNQQEIDDQLGR